ncbi:MAG TPA: hypothetical protein VGF98_09320 [Candidatus Tumulicola sp.]|jgi:hypothetical protein
MHYPFELGSVVLGLLAVAWYTGLWIAAPVRAGNASAALRILSMMVLGTLLPLVLATCDVLYWWTLWLALAVAIVARIRSSGSDRFADAGAMLGSWDVALAFTVLVALAWPVAVRPVMDGDSLHYHLPNAASWIVHHGLWTTDTRYWWYPPASELFASALLAIGGAGAAGWGALLPAALIVAVAREAAVRAGSPAFVGTLGACALLATPVAASQLISLRNDLWLAALFAGTLTWLWPPAMGVLALIKPYGFIFALASGAAWTRDRTRTLLGIAVAVASIGLWSLRDLALSRNAVVPIASTRIPDPWQSTIGANVPHSLSVLVAASWNAGWMWSLLLLAGAMSIVLWRKPAFGLAAALSLAALLFIPTAYEFGTVQQLASGESLRFALPLATLGLLWMLSLRAARWAVAAVASVGTIVGVATQWALFSNDATTHDTPLVVAVAGLVALAVAWRGSQRVRVATAVCAMALLGAWAAGVARNHPDDYVRDRFGGAAVYAGLHAGRPIVTFDLPAGAVIIVNPNARVIDGLDASVCAQARSLHAVIATSSTRLPSVNCGRIVYRDATSAVVL